MKLASINLHIAFKMFLDANLKLDTSSFFGIGAWRAEMFSMKV